MGHIAVVGAANLDISIRSYEKALYRDSNPGEITMHPGGVGRNIAENLARLGETVHFFTQLGEEPDATYLRTLSERVGMTVHDLSRETTKGNRYAALLDEGGDMMIGVADTKGIEGFSSGDFTEGDRRTIQNADALILETNLTPALIAFLVTLNKTVIMDTVSTAKAPRVMGVLANLHTLSMNLLEARKLIKSVDDPKIETIGEFFEARGVSRILVTGGEAGAWLYENGIARHHPVFHADMRNASGAGDAFVAGYAYGLSRHTDPLVPALASASIALESDRPVSESLTPDTLKRRMEAT